MPKKTKFISVYKVHLEDSDSNHQQSLLLSPGPIIVYSLLIYPCQSLTHSLSNSLVEIGLKFGRAFSKVLHGFVKSVAWTRPSKQCEFCNYIFDCQDCQSSPGGTSGPGDPGGPGGPLVQVVQVSRWSRWSRYQGSQGGQPWSYEFRKYMVFMVSTIRLLRKLEMSRLWHAN